jgi:hypothetical protein
MRILLLGLLLASQSLWAAPRQVDDLRWEGVERIVAIGDLHGDYAGYMAVLRASGLVDACLAGIARADKGDEAAVTAAVREATLALNELNARCNHHLIETDQREHLCALFGQAAIARGVGSGEDLTAPWREW